MYPIIFILVIGLCLSVNSFLIGAMKAQIFLIGNALALILIGMSFYFYDWKIGCIAIAAYLGASIAFKPFGVRIAAWLLRKTFQVEGKYVGLPSSKLKKISQKIIAHMNRPISVETLLTTEIPEDDLVEYCCSLPKIKEILMLHDAAKEDMLSIYHAMMIHGGAQWAGGHFVVASSVAYPETLCYFLEHGVTQKTVFDAIMYFERGIPLGVLKIQE